MNLNAQDVKFVIRNAFANVSRPSSDSIARCSRIECDECAGIRWGFRDLTHELILGMPYILEYHHDALPLLLPPAFHYFIPDFMAYSVDHPDSNVSFFTRLSLNGAHKEAIDLERIDIFSENQRLAVIVFLEFLKTQEIEGDERDNAMNREKIESIIKIWRTKNLHHEKNPEPNQVIEPTPMLGTSTAAQPPLPSTGVAHL
jgi:hypothetical protein